MGAVTESRRESSPSRPPPPRGSGTGGRGGRGAGYQGGTGPCSPDLAAPGSRNGKIWVSNIKQGQRDNQNQGTSCPILPVHYEMY